MAIPVQSLGRHGKRKQARRVIPFLALAITASLCAGLVPAHAARMSWSIHGLFVSVGYADNSRANPNLPVPWAGSPHVTFIGSVGPYDTGAIRLDNHTGHDIGVKDVKVALHSDAHGHALHGQVFDLWGTFSVKAHESVILAQTAHVNGNSTNFDTSDYPFIKSCTASAAASTDNPPKIAVTLADGSRQVFADNGHILDTGGADTAACRNESLQWRHVDTTSSAIQAALLTLSISPAAQWVRHHGVVTATLDDAGNEPLANVAITFRVLAGPNAGLSWHSVTDSNGQATIVYQGSRTGVDTLTAHVTNISGAGFDAARTAGITWMPH